MYYLHKMAKLFNSNYKILFFWHYIFYIINMSNNLFVFIIFNNKIIKYWFILNQLTIQQILHFVKFQRLTFIKIIFSTDHNPTYLLEWVLLWIVKLNFATSTSYLTTFNFLIMAPHILKSVLRPETLLGPLF